MTTRELGHSGLHLVPLVLGGNVFGWTADSTTSFAVLDAFVAGGGNAIDTADVYSAWAPGNEGGGQSETIIGKWLKQRGRRDDVLILTKVGKLPIDGQKNLAKATIKKAVEASLRRLQTDYIDLYQAHRYDYETPLEETMQAFADVVRSGKALYVGVSEWNAEQIRAGQELATQMGFRLVSNQPQYSMLWRVIEDQVVPTSKELGMGQVVWSPMAEGVLSGKYLPGSQPPAGSRATDEKGGREMIARWMTDPVLTAVQRLRPIAEQAGLTMAQLAVAWVLQNDNVSAALVGASRPEQLVENVKASGVRLEQDTLDAIDEALGDVVERDPSLTRSPSRLED